MDYKYYVSNNNGQDDYGLKYINEQGYGSICKQYKIEFPPQHQDKQPGMEYLMTPKPIFNNPYYKASGKLYNKVAIITGGDSGLGRATAVGFAKEGAKVDSAGGMGAKITPSAVLVIQNGNVQMINIKNQDAVNKLIDMAPGIASKLNFGAIFGKRNENKQPKEEVKFEEEIVTEE